MHTMLYMNRVLSLLARPSLTNQEALVLQIVAFGLVGVVLQASPQEYLMESTYQGDIRPDNASEDDAV
jgi:hypothetical protein